MTPLYKIPGFLLLPSSLIILLLLLALCGPKKLRRPSIVVAIALFTFGSIGPLSSALLAERERSFPVPEINQAPDYIVVLGSGHVSDSELPLLSQLYYPGLARVTQSVVLALQYPTSQLVFTGYAGSDTVSTADKGAEFAISLGINPDRIIRYQNPRNTYEEAEVVAPLLQGKNVLLITSASHLPRAVALFEAENISVTPYPTGHLAKGLEARGWEDWWPKASHWLVFETWAYEQLATARQWLSRQLTQ